MTPYEYNQMLKMVKRTLINHKKNSKLTLKERLEIDELLRLTEKVKNMYNRP